MVGHSFLNGGPCLTGLSTAIIHVLFGGSQEMATLSLSDCVDQDVRDVLALLEGTKDLSEEDKSQILSVTLPWDLPGVTLNNRCWLREKILLHAVLGRTTQQVKQIRRGLKDTGVWEFFSSRPDAVQVLFPRACNAEITPQVTSCAFEKSFLRGTHFLNQTLTKPSLKKLQEKPPYPARYHFPLSTNNLERPACPPTTLPPAITEKTSRSHLQSSLAVTPCLSSKPLSELGS
ncbi:uncharacterized protein LOC119795238 [Cyprinodon tularosa]|uniref:uncharacterized protein LOC119795238 n=1 Tax=Cyprinodon tularosa TaxID=77115 RepID=UPI0018E2764F|nr:uncharacterized protein LOC119795238 [Cyprinodon tularosa]